MGYGPKEAARETMEYLGAKLDRTHYVSPRGASSATKKNAKKDIFKQFKEVQGMDLQSATFMPGINISFSPMTLKYHSRAQK